jgi:flagellar biosynthesis chaperone FliJ
MPALPELYDGLTRANAEISKLEAQLKDLKSERDEYQRQIMNLLDEQGIRSAAIGNKTAVILEATVPHVTDWAAFYAYVLEQGAPELLERRPSAAEYRSLREQGRDVPGTEPFVRRTLSFRTNAS